MQNIELLKLTDDLKSKLDMLYSLYGKKDITKALDITRQINTGLNLLCCEVIESANKSENTDSLINKDVTESKSNENNSEEQNKFFNELGNMLKDCGVHTCYIRNNSKSSLNNRLYILFFSIPNEDHVGSKRLAEFLDKNGWSYTFMKNADRNIDMDTYTLYNHIHGYVESIFK